MTEDLTDQPSDLAVGTVPVLRVVGMLSLSVLDGVDRFKVERGEPRRAPSPEVWKDALDEVLAKDASKKDPSSELAPLAGRVSRTAQGHLLFVVAQHAQPVDGLEAPRPCVPPCPGHGRPAQHERGGHRRGCCGTVSWKWRWVVAMFRMSWAEKATAPVENGWVWTSTRESAPS